MNSRLLQPSSIETDLDRLELPPALERIGPTIRVAGHRISLIQILDAIFDGISTERLMEMFPTIPARKLAEVSSFCEQKSELLRRYHGEQQSAFAAAEAERSGQAPTLHELRRRRAERNGTGMRSD
jgi:uncharacterized protein (DUF433 family)